MYSAIWKGMFILDVSILEKYKRYAHVWLKKKIMKRRNIFNWGIDPAIAKLKKEIDVLPLAYHKINFLKKIFVLPLANAYKTSPQRHFNIQILIFMSVL